MAQQSTILIVDDEPFNVDLLEQQLEEFGYATVSASNGQEALDKVAAEAPDLILLDVMMPVMDGFTVCRILKENDETRLIPIVIMTALGNVEDRIRGIEAGADDFLTKPVDERELLARIQTTLRLKHTVDRKLGELRRIKDHFAKFVPEAVKRLVAANPEAPALTKQERDISVLFLDISGYARLSEQLAPAMLNTLVERYFSTFLDRIHGAQLWSRPGRLDPLRGTPRRALDLHGQRPSDQSSGTTGWHCRGWAAPGGSRDRTPPARPLSSDPTRPRIPEEHRRGRGHLPRPGTIRGDLRRTPPSLTNL